MKTIHLTDKILLVDETAEIKEDDIRYSVKDNDWYKTTNSDFEDGIQPAYKIIAASPKLGDLDEFETLPPNVKIVWNYTHDYSRLKVGMVLHKRTGSEVIIDEIKKDDSGRLCYYSSGVHFVTQYTSPHNMLTKPCYYAYEKAIETLPSNTEDDVEELAYDYFHTNKQQITQEGYYGVEKQVQGFIAGYKQAKSETMFSLEDIREAIDKGFDIHFEAHYLHTFEERDAQRKQQIEEYIQFLTKPKEYEFVPEMECGKVEQCECPSNNDCLKPQPKIINNKIQGTWKIK